MKRITVKSWQGHKEIVVGFRQESDARQFARACGPDTHVQQWSKRTWVVATITQAERLEWIRTPEEQAFWVST